MGRYLLLFVVLLAGCGPIRVTVGLVDAERAVREAKDAGAETHAVYPLTLAEELLAKAVEEKGYAEWEQSFILANEAVKRANEATAIAKDAAEAPLWPAVDASPDEPAEAPAEEPPPEATPSTEDELLDDSDLSDDLWGNQPEEAEPTPVPDDGEDVPEEEVAPEDEELLEGVEDKKKEEDEDPKRKSRKVE